MTTGSWAAVNRVGSFDRGPRDSVVITLVDGRRTGLRPIAEYEAARAEASELAKRTKQAIKVLPMTVAELFGYTGTTPTDLFQNPKADAEMRRLVVATCREAILQSDDREVRAEAHALLVGMGEGR